VDDGVGGPAVDRTRVLDELAQIPTGARRDRRAEMSASERSDAETGLMSVLIALTVAFST